MSDHDLVLCEVNVKTKIKQNHNVLSGVPQGTVLGPLCFLIFINDLGKNISSQTSLKLFADDSLLFRTINNPDDCDILQKDMNSLLSWADQWQINFHPEKCIVMSITNKRSPLHYDYSMSGHCLKRTESVRYLGVQLNASLKWNHHIELIVAKANRSLGFLRRNIYQCPEKVKEQAYKALVRPILEYACGAWDPHQQSHIKMVEQVQRTTARFVTNTRSNEPGSVTSALEKLGWDSLQSRRKARRLKLLHQTVNVKTQGLRIPGYYENVNKYSIRNNHAAKFSISS